MIEKKTGAESVFNSAPKETGMSVLI